MYFAEAKEVIYRMVRKADGTIDRKPLITMNLLSSKMDTSAMPAEQNMPPLSASLVRRTHFDANVNFDQQPIIVPLSLQLPSQPPPLECCNHKSALGAFGMFWKRNRVAWSGPPKLLGRRDAGEHPVDFARQMGVYLLQDDARTIYVGRAGDSIYARLKAHTSDRMAGRWNRFSWFGLRSVTQDGRLVSERSVWDDTIVISTIEALLIESMEPPLNRRRGDGLTGLEYLQVCDPLSESVALRPPSQEPRKCIPIPCK